LSEISKDNDWISRVAPGCLLRKGDGESTVVAVDKMVVTIGNGGGCEEDSCDRLCLVHGLGRQNKSFVASVMSCLVEE
jgi:hypothetical protein